MAEIHPALDSCIKKDIVTLCICVGKCLYVRHEEAHRLAKQGAVSTSIPISEQGMGVDLEAIEARANAATPGPQGIVTGGASFEFKTIVVNDPGEWLAFVKSQEDGRFFAHARTDIPALIAEVRRLREELEIAYSAIAPLTRTELAARSAEPQVTERQRTDREEGTFAQGIEKAAKRADELAGAAELGIRRTAYRVAAMNIRALTPSPSRGIGDRAEEIECECTASEMPHCRRLCRPRPALSGSKHTGQEEI